MYFVKGQCWYKFLLRSLVIVQIGICIPVWHQMCGKKATNSGARRVLDYKKKVIGLVELYNLQIELCG